MWSIYTIEYHINSHKKDEILPFVTTWMDLESIMLNKISQREKNYCMTPLMWQVNKHIDQRTEWWLPEGKGVGRERAERVKGHMCTAMDGNWTFGGEHEAVYIKVGL